MKHWIPFPRVEGQAPRQAHVGLPPGTYEREMSKEGFFGPATELYHRHPPTGWTSWEGPLRPRAFDLEKLDAAAPSPWRAPTVLRNPHLEVRYWQAHGAMDHLVRNGDGDQLIFVHGGGGDLFCDFGHLTFAEGDYLVLPRGTMWRVECDQPATLLLVEATSDSFGLPPRGLIGQHAPFDPGVLDVPRIDAAFAAQQTEEPWRIVIKRRGELSTVTFPYNPLDVVGWSGTLLAVRINWRDIRPVTSPRLHLPPSVHTTFASTRFVVCTFVPRPLERDPAAQKLPFFHNNDDYDEIIFYHSGRFLSRDGIRPGMLTLHPSGFTHGPHPGALAAAARAAPVETDEVAVMIDARDLVEVDACAAGVEWPGYVESWKPR
jgi:homogentisate 1,2-dioxygenase